MNAVDEAKQLFSNVNNWLKHAEAKHGVLVAFNSAAIFGLANVLDKIRCFTFGGYVWCLSGIVLLALAAIIGLFSFLPILKAPTEPRKKRKGEKLNPIYFADVASLTAEELVEKLQPPKSVQKDDIALWYCDQVVINSRIALRKYRLFTAAVSLNLFTIFPPILLYGVYRIINRIIRRIKNDR